LARVEGVTLISLQRGAGADQLKALGGRFPVLDLGELLDRTGDPFLVTCAIMANLNLVITIDTASAHLAGGLGLPAWVALHYVPDWRWLLGREDSPWYPTLRLFRQTAQGDWAAVFQKMAEALAPLAARCARERSLVVGIPPGELLDKLTMLEIKGEHTSSGERDHFRARRDSLAALRENLGSSPELTRLAAELRTANDKLLQAENAIRACEGAQDFGPCFVELARSIRRINEQRAALKQAVNALFDWPPDRCDPEY
jgi:hypothetical protein